MQLTLTGTDGIPWDLTNGPVRAMGGTNLFNTVPLTHRWKTRALRDGGDWAGVKAEQRDITLPVKIKAPDAASFVDLESRFFASLDPEGWAYVTATTPWATSRNLALKFVSDGNPTDPTDPIVVREKTYQLALLTGWPYWRGDDFTATYQQKDVKDFLVNDGTGAILYISSDAAFQQATATNLGDIKSWHTLTLAGPILTWSITIGDSVMTSARSLVKGEALTIAPETESITDQNGNRAWEWLDKKSFTPIPKGEDIPLTIEVTGVTSDTSVSIALPTWYRRYA